jgi:hypothetical protein
MAACRLVVTLMVEPDGTVVDVVLGVVVVVVEGTVDVVTVVVVLVVGATVVVVVDGVTVVVVVEGGWVVVVAPLLVTVPQISASARPTFFVVLLTAVIVILAHVICRVLNASVNAAPLLGNDPVEMLLPSLKLMVAAVI